LMPLAHIKDGTGSAASLFGRVTRPSYKFKSARLLDSGRGFLDQGCCVLDLRVASAASCIGVVALCEPPASAFVMAVTIKRTTSSDCQ
jgi:hypothetical protein